MPGSGEAQLPVGEQMLRKGSTGASPSGERDFQALAPHGLGAPRPDHQIQPAPKTWRPAFKKAVELAPPTPPTARPRSPLGIVGQYEKATELKRVVATPGYKEAAAWVNLGWVYRNMKPPKTTESIAAYKKALELDPKEEQSALGLGWAYSYTKSWDDAIAAFNKAIQIEPKTAGEANNGIAWCYFFKKDFANAKAFGEKAQAGGRNDARLKENIDRVEKALLDTFQAGIKTPDIGGTAGTKAFTKAVVERLA
jgi:superkiller protein 3